MHSAGRWTLRKIAGYVEVRRDGHPCAGATPPPDERLLARQTQPGTRVSLWAESRIIAGARRWRQVTMFV